MFKDQQGLVIHTLQIQTGKALLHYKLKLRLLLLLSDCPQVTGGGLDRTAKADALIGLRFVSRMVIGDMSILGEDLDERGINIECQAVWMVNFRCRTTSDVRYRSSELGYG